MYALITGASSGMGKDFARLLAEKGYDLIIVARRLEKLESLKAEIKNKEVIVYQTDLSIKENVFTLYDNFKEYDIRVLINNAGFGYLSEFNRESLDKNLELIDTNITASTILFNLFLDKFKNIENTYILNVASAASFTIGPLLGVYYASKSYLYRLTLSTYEELRRNKSKTRLSVLCPGPVRTEFDKVANVSFSLKSQSSMFVSKYALKKMFKHKLIIIPSFKLRLAKFATRFVSDKALARIGYGLQKRKTN